MLSRISFSIIPDPEFSMDQHLTAQQSSRVPLVNLSLYTLLPNHKVNLSSAPIVGPKIPLDFFFPPKLRFT